LAGEDGGMVATPLGSPIRRRNGQARDQELRIGSPSSSFNYLRESSCHLRGEEEKQIKQGSIKAKEKKEKAYHESSKVFSSNKGAKIYGPLLLQHNL